MRLPPAARLLHAGLTLGLALTGALGLATWHGEGRETPLDRLESALLDLRFHLAGPRPAPDAVVIVEIDDAAVAEAGSFPLPRPALARLVRAIHARAPRALGLDLLLAEASGPEDDAGLAASLSEARAVLAAAAVFPRGSGPALAGPSRLPAAARVLQPLDRFRHGTAVGLANVSADRGGIPRHLPLLVAQGDTLFPSLALRLAAQGSGAEPVLGPDRLSLGESVSRLDLGASLPLRFYGPRGSVRTVSAAALLRGEPEGAALRGRLVLVGATVVGGGDTFASPFDPVLPGVEVLATGLAHLVAGDGLVRDGAVRRIDSAAALGLALGAALLLILLPPAPAAGLIGAAALAWLAAAMAAFAGGVWLSATIPLAALAPVLVVGLGGRLVLDRRDARALAAAEQALRAFHPPRLAARLTGEPGFLARPLVQEAAILFLDLSGFTGVSERLGPLATQAMLKDFHTRVEACVTRHGGLVVTFMGDGAMCAFGLAEPGPADARRALAAALDLVPLVRTWLDGEPAFDGRGDLRVGVHHGTVVVSRLGGDDHQQITATGDSVNIASRLMEVAKELRAALVASEALLAAAGSEAAAAAAFEGRRTIAIRGRSQGLAVAYRWARDGKEASTGLV